MRGMAVDSGSVPIVGAKLGPVKRFSPELPRFARIPRGDETIISENMQSPHTVFNTLLLQ